MEMKIFKDKLQNEVYFSSKLGYDYYYDFLNCSKVLLKILQQQNEVHVVIKCNFCDNPVLAKQGW